MSKSAKKSLWSHIYRRSLQGIPSQTGESKLALREGRKDQNGHIFSCKKEP